MVPCCTNICVRQCSGNRGRAEIVREKVYEPALAGREPRTRRYYTELFDEQVLSCWRRHPLQPDRGRLTA